MADEVTKRIITCDDAVQLLAIQRAAHELQDCAGGALLLVDPSSGQMGWIERRYLMAASDRMFLNACGISDAERIL